jgi:microcystin-dependent protein
MTCNKNNYIKYMSWKSLPPKLSLVNNETSYFNNLSYQNSNGYETTTSYLNANNASINNLNVEQNTTLNGNVYIEGDATINGKIILDGLDVSGNIVTQNYVSTGSKASGQFVDPNIGNGEISLCSSQENANFDNSFQPMPQGLYFGSADELNVPRIVLAYDSSGNVTGIEYNSCATGNGSYNQHFYVQDGGVKYTSMALNTDGSVSINDLECVNFQTDNFNATNANYENITASNSGIIGNFLTCGTNNSSPDLKLTLAGYVSGVNFDGTQENIQPGVYFGDDSDFNVPRITQAKTNNVLSGINYISYSSQANNGHGHYFYTQDNEGNQRQAFTIDSLGTVNALEPFYANSGIYSKDYTYFENTGSIGPKINSSSQPVGINYYTKGPNNGYSYEHVFYVQNTSGNSEVIMSIDENGVSINNGLFVSGTSVNGNLEYDPNTFVPLKGIVMYTGDGTELNKNYWVLCDGNGGVKINGITIPDLRGRFIVSSTYGNSVSLEGETSMNYDLNQTGGKQQVTLTTEEIPSHTHEISFSGRKDASEGGENTEKEYLRSEAQDGESISNLQSIQGEIKHTGGDGAHENRPAYYVLAFIIRIK